MKKIIPAIFILFFFLPFYGQTTLIQGRIINKETGEPVSAVKIIRVDSLYDVRSDKNGFFNISLPEKKKTKILFSHPQYLLFTKEIKPELVNAPILVSLNPVYMVNKDSIHRIQYKNTLSFAPVELLFLGLTFEYERTITNKHGVGGYATVLINRRFWMFNDNISLTGFKLEPYYRYYLWTNQRTAGFAQVKMIYANFIVYEDVVYNEIKETPSQAFGLGIAWGWKIFHPKLKRHTIQLVVGAKFVPIVSNTDELNDIFGGYQTEYWWDLVGPGSIVDVKFTLGGIF